MNAYFRWPALSPYLKKRAKRYSPRPGYRSTTPISTYAETHLIKYRSLAFSITIVALGLVLSLVISLKLGNAVTKKLRKASPNRVVIIG